MSSIQLSVFEYQGRRVRTTPDGRFSVFDVIEAFLSSDSEGHGRNVNPRQVFKTLTQSYPDLVHRLDYYQFSGRGQRPTPVLSREGIVKILMLFPGQAGSQFRDWASNVICERIEEEAKPELAYTRGRERAIKAWKRQGLSDSEIAAQLDGIDARNEMTAAFRSHGVDDPKHYAQATNILYFELLGKTAAALRKELNLRRSDRLRSYFKASTTRALALIETLTAEDVEEHNLYGPRLCLNSAESAAKRVSQVFKTN